jgi:hypothetical protein
MVTVPHEVHRLAVPVAAPFDDFRARYEEAVPPFDAARFEAMKRDGADWVAIMLAAAKNAPHDFMIYATTDIGAIMEVAGHPARCVTYLMGNHTIAERMYRHYPGVMLYAPLRTAIYEDAAGTTWFTTDQPSTHFDSFGDAAITKVGLELDGKLALLLTLLDAPVPAALTPRGALLEATVSAPAPRPSGIRRRAAGLSLRHHSEKGKH